MQLLLCFSGDEKVIKINEDESSKHLADRQTGQTWFEDMVEDFRG